MSTISTIRTRRAWLAGQSLVLPLAAIGACVVGAMLASAYTLAVLFATLPWLVVLARQPTSVWLAGALVAAVTFPGLASFGLIPRFAQFVHLPLVWGAFGIAILSRRADRVQARFFFFWFGLLIFAFVTSSFVNGSPPVRGLSYYALLAEPFAVAAVLLLDPPQPGARRMLIRVAGVLVIIQIPVAYAQVVVHGRGDLVQGTLVGLGAGAHLVAALVIVGAFWFIGSFRSVTSPTAILVLVLSLSVLLMADAKQLIFALPAIIFAQRILSTRTMILALTALLAIIAVLQFKSLNQGYTVPYINRALAGETGKVRVASRLWTLATDNSTTFIAGQGPAETVSRAAYGTVPEYQNSGSALDKLGLEPARFPYEAEAIAVAAVRETGETGGAFQDPFGLDSFDSGTSSSVGIFGDLGALGFIAYFGLFGAVFFSLRRLESSIALAAASGFAMLIVLGFILDWLEQPPFMVFLGVLAGLALTESRPQER